MPAGRPTHLTPKLQAAIVIHLERGLPVEYACQAVGISKQMFYQWKKLGLADPKSVYGKFLDCVKRTEAALMSECMEAIKNAVKSWQSRAWILERKWPEIWSSDRELVQELKRFLREQKKREANGDIDPATGEPTAQTTTGTEAGNAAPVQGLDPPLLPPSPDAGTVKPA